MDPESPNVLHTVSARASWSRANEKGVFPGVSSVLNWSVWGEIGERGTRRAAYELGLLDETELEPPASVDQWMWSIFYGRPAANVDSWRELYDRGLAASGAGGATQRQVFGSATANAETGGRVETEPGPARDRRAQVAANRPAALRHARDGLRAVRSESIAWWRDATRSAARADPGTARARLAEAVEWFERADPLHIMVSLFATEAVTDLAHATERAGRPEAANAMMVGYSGMEEFETTAALWEVSRGQRTLEAFLADHGFHGSQEGEIASVSWRERPAEIEAVARRYAALHDDEDPRRREERAVETRRRLETEIRAALPAKDRAGVDEIFERVATFLPLREAGRATLTIGLDAMRAQARVLGRSLADAGRIDSPEDVFLLTRHELIESPRAIRERVEARRVLRAHYAGFELPETWRGMPSKRPPEDSAERATPRPASGSMPLRLDGLGVSSGIHEGTARVVLDARLLGDDFAAGDVLVAPATDPSWAPLFLIAGAVVIDTGSNLSHAAVVAREMGIPAVVAVEDASRRIPNGARLRVDGTTGRVEVLG